MGRAIYVKIAFGEKKYKPDFPEQLNFKILNIFKTIILDICCITWLP